MLKEMLLTRFNKECIEVEDKSIIDSVISVINTNDFDELFTICKFILSFKQKLNIDYIQKIIIKVNENKELFEEISISDSNKLILISDRVLEELNKPKSSKTISDHSKIIFKCEAICDDSGEDVTGSMTTQSDSNELLYSMLCNGHVREFIKNKIDVCISENESIESVNSKIKIVDNYKQDAGKLVNGCDCALYGIVISSIEGSSTIDIAFTFNACTEDQVEIEEINGNYITKGTLVVDSSKLLFDKFENINCNGENEAIFITYNS